MAKSAEAKRVARHCLYQKRVKNSHPFRKKTCLSYQAERAVENQAVLTDKNEEKDDLFCELAEHLDWGQVVDADGRIFFTLTHAKVSARVTSEGENRDFFRARPAVAG